MDVTANWYGFNHQATDGTVVRLSFANWSGQAELCFLREISEGHHQQVLCRWTNFDKTKAELNFPEEHQNISSHIKPFTNALLETLRAFENSDEYKKLDNQKARFPDLDDMDVFRYGIETIFADLKLMYPLPDRNVPQPSAWEKVKSAFQHLVSGR